MVGRLLTILSFGAKSLLVGGFNPFEKHSSDWIISPGRGKHKKSLKPPVMPIFRCDLAASFREGRTPSDGSSEVSNSPRTLSGHLRWGSYELWTMVPMVSHPDFGGFFPGFGHFHHLTNFPYKIGETLHHQGTLGLIFTWKQGSYGGTCLRFRDPEYIQNPYDIPLNTGILTMA